MARTHASRAAAEVDLEDLLVSLADKIWKAKRVPDLEQVVTRTPRGRERPGAMGSVHGAG
ncbi:MAG TPA: hypothetical protein VJT49_06200 [Amycolatopsis sp.]|uniref:hypothetical protein n=1 Tax=Amycolatopsis sp. TaxID=37632 RepID=UPI002B47C65A|nr:hypothetical protein [Amycolatopsis sp.]HKS44698.1 hypothetical protein [Amycolatopsis sp.]